MLKFLIFVFLLPLMAKATWPDGPWLDDVKPPTAVQLYAVAFGSPFDFQFIKMMGIWKKFEKKYKDLGVEFLIVTQPENGFPFSSEIVRQTTLSRNFTLPTYLDYGGNYSKKWRAYVSPTINLVLKNEKVVSFDPGYFDGAAFEKSLQRSLKEAGVNKLPNRDYVNENEGRGCAHGSTFFLGQRQRSVWGKDPVEISGPWLEKESFIEKDGGQQGQLIVDVKDSNLAIVAESTNGAAQQIKIQGEQNKIPSSNRGVDLQENKNGDLLLNVKDLRIYEILSSPDSNTFKNQKILLQTNSKNLRIWAFQTLPHCRNFK